MDWRVVRGLLTRTTYWKFIETTREVVADERKRDARRSQLLRYFRKVRRWRWLWRVIVTTSEGQRLGDSRILHRKLDDIRRKDKAVSRCVRGSTGREKARKSLASVHLKARNARLDMHHKVSLELVRRFGFIAAEDLDVQAMLKNKRLARQIKDAGWSSFIQILTRKCQMHGCRIALVNPRGTSQTCSQCGAVVAKLLWQRTHTCSCGLSIHRDLNAARNILARAEPGFANVGNGLLEPEAATAV
jgi:IS605 OrfB family transposase